VRDILITLGILGTIPYILKRPWLGALVALWISLMSPHRFSWGFAYSMPFVAIIVAATVAGMLANRSAVNFPRNAATALLIAFAGWMTVTLIFSLELESAFGRWTDVMKMFIIVLITASVLQGRKHAEWLVWVIVVSVGFYGVKGGLFTILTGGESRVWGPPGRSYISDNNAIAVALVMVIPLMQYLRHVATSKWIKWGLLGAMLLSGVAVLGTHSRGALLAVCAMGFFLWLKGRNKGILAVAILIMVAFGIQFMPDNWTDRMRSIENYEQDASAMGRINTWKAAFNVANSRITGAGFEWYNLRNFARYAPNPEDVHAAHSIYFQMMGEHGYIGLLLFLSLGAVAWSYARRIIAAARAGPELEWAGQLARAVQVSLIGYGSGGTFVNIGYWDLPYMEIVLLGMLLVIVRAPKADPAAATPAPGQA
jgi:putative inorganic carbon (hco3(-)) transporter